VANPPGDIAQRPEVWKKYWRLVLYAMPDIGWGNWHLMTLQGYGGESGAW
jgi:hypothetical protein